ncbi:hypothetical protein [Aureimonas sp. OT7]|uniref:hypothetical protein n=1 Tax=Aureimonas sp. OT7 TaxID=2816454 RepID=UPI0019D54471|nr:hypothetical protein [Aureimonas sp. OT7]
MSFLVPPEYAVEGVPLVLRMSVCFRQQPVRFPVSQLGCSWNIHPISNDHFRSKTVPSSLMPGQWRQPGSGDCLLPLLRDRMPIREPEYLDGPASYFGYAVVAAMLVLLAYTVAGTVVDWMGPVTVGGQD